MRQLSFSVKGEARSFGHRKCTVGKFDLTATSHGHAPRVDRIAPADGPDLAHIHQRVASAFGPQYRGDAVRDIALRNAVQRQFGPAGHGNAILADLNAIEEAASYRQLMDRFGHTQEKLAEALNKSRSHISNVLRLLNLPEPVQAMLRDSTLSAGHARALITADDPVGLARKVVERGLSVRETEQLVRDQSAPKPERLPPREGTKDADTRAIESDLTAQLKMRVRIDHAGQDGGRVTITYRDLDQLDRLCQMLGGTA